MDDDDARTLMMPFVVTYDPGDEPSVSRPFAAEAFVAGACYAQISERLTDQLTFTTYADPRLVPQLDLLAMHRCYLLTCEPWAEFPDEWTLAVFTRVDGTD